MTDLEHHLRTLLQTGGSVDDAIWTLSQEQHVGQILLSRAVATVFTLTLTEARHVVRGAVERQGRPRQQPQRPDGPGWPDREVGVLETLEQRLPRWRHRTPHDAVYRACFLPSGDRPLLITVDGSSTPLLTAVATEPFSGPDPQGRVQVPRWPVPLRVDTELQSWSVQARLPEGVLRPLEERAEALVRVYGDGGMGIGVDGVTVVGFIARGEHLTPFRTWSPSAQQAPACHAFLSALVAVTLDVSPQGQVHQAAQAVAQHLASRA